MIKHINIKPLIGIEELSLGIEMSTALVILGEPEDKSSREYDDGSCDKIWEYLNEGLILTFSSDDNWLLGDITVESPDAELEGVCLIGLDENEFLEKAKQAGIDPIFLEDDFKDLDSRNYVCDKMGLSFWVHEGILESITIFPEHDESGNIPIWPKS